MENETFLSDNDTDVKGRGHFPVSQWAHNVEFVFLIVVIGIGIPGNLLLFLVQVKNKKRTTTDILLMAMAIYEFFCSCINAPWKLIKIFDSVWVAMGSPFLCKFTLFSINFTNLGAAQMLASIAADRYIKTCMPLSTFYSEKQAKIICGVVMVTTTILSVPHIGLIYWNEEWLFCEMIAWWIFDPVQYGIKLNMVFIGAFTIIIFSYLRINFFLRSRYRQKVQKRSQSTRSNAMVSNSEKDSSITVAVTDLSSSTNSSNGNTTTAMSMSTTIQDVNAMHQSAGQCENQLHKEQISTDDTKVQMSADDEKVQMSTDDEKVQMSTDDSKVQMSNDENQVHRTPNVNKIQSSTTTVANNRTKASTDGKMIKTTKHQKLARNLSRNLETEAHNLNKLTLAMSLITLIYIFTGIFSWVSFFTGPIYGWDLLHLGFSLPLVNCISNPILLFSMTERFRTSAKQLCLAGCNRR